MDEETVDNAVEAAKSGSQALEHLTELFSRLAGPLASELGQMMGDKVRVYRMQNWLRCADRISVMLLEAKAEPRAIPSRLFLPALEAASLEDDPDLQELWAGLIANMATHDTETPAAYITFLKELSRDEALALEDLFHTTANKSWMDVDSLTFLYPPGGAVFTEGDLFRALGRSMTKDLLDKLYFNKDYKRTWTIAETGEYGVIRARAAIANLLRLQILERTVPKEEPANRLSPDEPCYCFTALGWMFLISCQPPGKVKRFRF